jgi:hypothetical protein
MVSSDIAVAGRYMSGLPSVGIAFASCDQVWAAMDGGVGGVVRDAISKAGSVPVKKIWERSMPVETCG